MILNDSEVKDRLESPGNLLNRLRKVTHKDENPMSIFVPSEPQPPSNAFTYFTGDGFDFGKKNDESSAVFDSASLDADKIDELVEDSAKKIKLGIVKARALDVLHDSLGELNLRLGEVAKVRDLATIAKDMNSILTAEDSKKNNIGQQVIVYKPIINDISKYETLVVTE